MLECPTWSWEKIWTKIKIICYKSNRSYAFYIGVLLFQLSKILNLLIIKYQNCFSWLFLMQFVPWKIFYSNASIIICCGKIPYRRNPMLEESRVTGIPCGRNPVWEESHGRNVMWKESCLGGILCGRNPIGGILLGGIPWPPLDSPIKIQNLPHPLNPCHQKYKPKQS